MLISYACVIICSGLRAFWREIDGSKLGVFWLWSWQSGSREILTETLCQKWNSNPRLRTWCQWCHVKHLGCIKFEYCAKYVSLCMQKHTCCLPHVKKTDHVVSKNLMIFLVWPWRKSQNELSAEKMSLPVANFSEIQNKQILSWVWRGTFVFRLFWKFETSATGIFSQARIIAPW